MKIKSKGTLPSGGFVYVQPGYESIPFPGMNGWTQQVSSILTFRKGNKLARATAVEVSEDLEAYTCSRMPGLCRDYTDGDSKKNGTSLPRRSSVAGAVAGLLDRAKRGFDQAKRGSQTISSWLGEGGKPVPPELSELRAKACTSGFIDTQGKPAKCPYNKAESGFSMTGSVAATVREWSEAKNELNLSTPQDADLGICENCGCHLKLKVHTPIKHITKFMDPGLLELFPEDFCWIRKEAEAQSQLNK